MIDQSKMMRSRSHGTLRGLKHVNKSSLEGTRFGRMFRWLPGETYAHADLSELSRWVVQQETTHFRKTDGSEASLPPPEPVTEGPDVVYTFPFKRDPPDTNTLLDTAYQTPEAGDENPTIPAGYTYFGQFIDHDLTFDPNSSLQKQNDPDATEDFRTPRFDLDSLYGRGPDDQPYLYKDTAKDGGGIRFLLGRTTGASPVERPGELPRNVEGRALTGDPRNDENGIICQLQAMFLNFHNRVVDTLTAEGALPSNHDVFLTAQRIVRWHYQYLILNDYLRRIVGDETWKAVFQGTGSHHPDPHLRVYKPKNDQGYMPVEFSVAAFRFGHSMVRPSYALQAGNAAVGGSPTTPFATDPRFHRIPIFTDRRDRGSSLDGFGPLPEGWEIDWNLFFSKDPMPVEVAPDGPDKGTLQVKAQDDAHRTQPGYRIDTQLVDPLAMLPPNVAKSGNMPDGIPVLAYRNLVRGSAFELPSGENVARALKLKHKTLSPQTIFGTMTADATKGLKDFSTPAGNPFWLRTPLWFYILKEAELTKKAGFEKDLKGGHHLGPVGGHLVAEVLVGLALADHTSYLVQDAAWTPAAEKDKSGFDAGAPLTTLYELIHWTTKGTMTL